MWKSCWISKRFSIENNVSWWLRGHCSHFKFRLLIHRFLTCLHHPQNVNQRLPFLLQHIQSTKLLSESHNSYVYSPIAIHTPVKKSRSNLAVDGCQRRAANTNFSDRKSGGADKQLPATIAQLPLFRASDSLIHPLNHHHHPFHHRCRIVVVLKQCAIKSLCTPFCRCSRKRQSLYIRHWGLCLIRIDLTLIKACQV